MEPVWLKSYPAGVPAEIDIFRFASLRGMLEESCRRYAKRPAFSNMGVAVTYGEFDRLSRNFSAYLQQVLGLRRGDRVAIMLPNLLQYPVALFGALRAGMVVVSVNPLYTARELQHQLADSGAVAIVVLENFAHTLQEVVATTAVRHIITTQVGDLFPPVRACLVNLTIKWVKRMVPRWHLPGAIGLNTALKLGAGQTPTDVALTHEDIAFLQYTGGTTGVAKGAILTHGNMVANVEQTSAWIGGTLKEGTEVVITPLPLYHIFALTANLLTFVKWGANNVSSPIRAIFPASCTNSTRPGSAPSPASTPSSTCCSTPPVSIRCGRPTPAPSSLRWPAAWRCSARWRSAGSRRWGCR
jgi:long-chain acyl-CoA synthetase